MDARSATPCPAHAQALLPVTPTSCLNILKPVISRHQPIRAGPQNHPTGPIFQSTRWKFQRMGPFSCENLTGVLTKRPQVAQLSSGQKKDLSNAHSPPVSHRHSPGETWWHCVAQLSPPATTCHDTTITTLQEATTALLSQENPC